MTKPIDWESEEQRPAVQVYHRLEVLQQSNLGEDRRWATPSDIASALAAMGEGERAEVLAAFHGDSIVHRHLQEQVERAEANHLSAVALVTELRHKLAAAEGCADACRAETRRIDAVCSDVQRERDGLRRSFNVAMTDCAKAAARAEKAEEETVEARASADRAWRAVSEARKEQLLAEGAQEKAERERDEAREARDRSTRLRDAMMPDTRAALDAEQYEDALTAALRVVAERDSLRGKIEALEKELFSARLTLGSLQHEEDVTRRQLKAEPCESIPGALRRVVQGLERERDKARAEQERLLQSNARYSAAADEAMRDRDAALGERNRAQAERDEARKELGTLHVERQAIAAAIGLLPGERIGEGRLSVAACLACEERDSLRASNARYSKLADEALADRGEALADLESEARDAHDARCELEQLRTRLIAAETAAAQRDEARKELGTLHVERQAIAAALGLLPGERIGEGRLSIAARLACEERDELRVKNDGLRDCLKERKTICEDAIKRAIASETAAAQREPREYPLAEGSSWSGEVIIDGLGQTIRGTETALQISWGSTTRASVWQNVLALAHRRGLV